MKTDFRIVREHMLENIAIMLRYLNHDATPTLRGTQHDGVFIYQNV